MNKCLNGLIGEMATVHFIIYSFVSSPCCSPSVSDSRVLLQGGTECGQLLGQPLHHRVLQLGLVGAVETVEGIWIVQRVHLHIQTYRSLNFTSRGTALRLSALIDLSFFTFLHLFLLCNMHTIIV